MYCYESRNFYCDGYIPDGVVVNDEIDYKLNFNNVDDRKNNIEINFKELAKATIYKDNLAQDLIRIAVYVYIADCMTKRGSKEAVSTDPYDEYWNVNLNFYIPVLELNFWNREEVKGLLSKALGFVVGHKYKFNFCSWIEDNKQLLLDLPTKKLDIDCISMFSGGLDSLYSSLLLLEEDRKPLLLSHQSNNKLVKKRTELKDEVAKVYNDGLIKWELPLKKKNGNSIEFTQRSRSFVYACLGIGFAKCLDLEDVYLSDNGIVSFNLRSTDQNIGTLNTRSTNPKLIYYVNELSKLMWQDKAPKVENKLIHLTKADVVKGIKKLNQDKLLPLTHSCVSTLGLTNVQPFCGVCSQCVDRRFATEYAEISKANEPLNSYKVDIFRESLTSQIDRKIGKTHAENYYRKAKIIQNASELEFMEYFNELWGFIPDNEDESDFLSNAMILHKRFSEQVIKVLGNFGAEYLSGKFPENSLVDMVYKNSNVPVNINDYKPIKEKRLIVDLKHKNCIFDKKDFKLTNKEIFFINKLAENKGTVIKYKELVSKATNHLELAKKRKQTIENKFEKFCKVNEIIPFELFESQRGYGYKLTLDKDEILAL